MTANPQASDSTVTGKRCCICGSQNFGFGDRPRGAGDVAFQCLECKSLERHRIIYAAYQPLLPIVRTWRAFQFAPDASVSRGWFASYLSAHFAGPQPVDMMNSRFADSSFDLIIANHVLEHVSDDRQALADSLRVVGPEGVVHISVPDPMWRQFTEDWGFADPAQNQHFRIYGADFPWRVGSQFEDVFCLGISGRDPVTGKPDIFYFLSRSAQRLTAIEQVLAASGILTTRFWRQPPDGEPVPYGSPRDSGLEASTTTPKSWEELIEAARADLRAGRLGEAETKFHAIRDNWPNHPSAYAGLAEVAQAAGDWHVALERWQECVTRFEATAPTAWRLALAWTTFHAGQLNAAETAFIRLSEEAPDDSRPLTGLAYCVMHQKRLHDAAELFENLIRRFPGEKIDEWQLQRARCFESSGKPWPATRI